MFGCCDWNPWSENAITEPTCHKSSNATLFDVILTSNYRIIAGTLNTDVGLSDYHNLVALSTKLHLPRLAQKVKSYRSYKHFDEEIYKRDISFAPFHVGYIFDEFDDTFWFNQTLLSNIIDSHAPVKRKGTVKKKPYPAWTLVYVKNATGNQCCATNILNIDLNRHGKTIENCVIKYPSSKLFLCTLISKLGAIHIIWLIIRQNIGARLSPLCPININQRDLQ